MSEYSCFAQVPLYQGGNQKDRQYTAKGKITEGQTMIYITLHTTLNIEQHEPYKNWM